VLTCSYGVRIVMNGASSVLFVALLGGNLDVTMNSNMAA
jgi:hypothetical protein